MSKRNKSLSNCAVPILPGNSDPTVSNFCVLSGIATIVACVFIAYLPAINGGFIWDDDKLLTENELVKAPGGLSSIWCTNEAIDFWPATNSTFWIEWRLWQMNPAGYHVTNLILHIAEALLVWLILRKLCIPGAYLAALIFALHPVNVESVAWIASRKNLMAMLFFLISILWYLKGMQWTVDGGQRPVGGPRGGSTVYRPTLTRPGNELPSPCSAPDARYPRPGSSSFILHPSSFHFWYCLSLAAFLLAMLSKGSAVVLPVLLLGIIWWLRPLRWRDLAWIAPFFVVAGILTRVNMWFQVRNTGTVFRSADFLNRLLGAAGTVWFYLYKAIFPLDLDPIYRQWNIQTSEPLWWLPLLAALGFTAVLWLYRDSWSRAFLFAWGFFCVAIFPVMGFTDVGFMRYTLVADRYQHVAIIGAIALAAAGFSAWQRRMGRKRIGAAAARIAAALALGMLAFMTWRQCGIYRGPIIYYRTALENNPDFWLGHYNLGVVLEKAGGRFEAAKHYEQLLRVQPDHSEALCNLAAILIREGRYQEAADHLKIALKVHPDYPEIQNNMGLALMHMGRPREAIEYSAEAIRLRPDFYEAHCNLADAFFDAGRFPEAVEQYEQALRLQPDQPEYHYNVGVALANTGRYQEAVPHFEQAIRLRPSYLAAHNNLAAMLVKIGRSQEAIEHYEKALSFKPDFAEAQFNLGVAYANVHESSNALAAAEKALQFARSQGNTTLTRQIEQWLDAYRARLSKPQNQ